MQVLAYTGNDDPKKFVLDGELTLSSVKVGILLLQHIVVGSSSEQRSDTNPNSLICFVTFAANMVSLIL